MAVDLEKFEKSFFRTEYADAQTLWQRITRLLSASARRPGAENFTEKQLLMANLEMLIKIYDELRIANRDLMLEERPADEKQFTEV